MRKQRVVLEHQADAALLRRHERVRAADLAAVEQHAPGVGALDARPRPAAASSCRSRNGRAGRRARPARSSARRRRARAARRRSGTTPSKASSRRDRRAGRAALAPTRKSQPVAHAALAAAVTATDSSPSAIRLGSPARPRLEQAARTGRRIERILVVAQRRVVGGDRHREPGGMRPSSKPAPFSSSRPGRSSTASRPKWSRKAGVVP